MRGTIAMETLLISVVAIILLIFAGKAIQAYGTKFVEDVDRMAWIRQSVYKIYASVRVLETCGVGSIDTVDIYVPKGGTLYLFHDKITGRVTNINRDYDKLKDKEYVYYVTTNTRFHKMVIIPHGWARIRLKKTADNEIEVNTIMVGLRSWKDVE